MVRWVQWLLLAGLLQISVVCIFLLAPGLLSARLYALQELLVYPGDRFYDGRLVHCSPPCNSQSTCMPSRDPG